MSAFVGGFVFGWSARADAVEAVELTELGGNLLSLALWFIFGAGFVIPAFEDLDARIVIYAVVSLIVVRMVPVALALIGTRQGRATVAFVGWFGPRGLASVVFALLAIEELGGTDPRVIVAVNTIAVTIVFSVIAPRHHGEAAGHPLPLWAQQHTHARRWMSLHASPIGETRADARPPVDTGDLIRVLQFPHGRTVPSASSWSSESIPRGSAAWWIHQFLVMRAVAGWAFNRWSTV